jgi:hypothetical protein
MRIQDLPRHLGTTSETSRPSFAIAQAVMAPQALS